MINSHKQPRFSLAQKVILCVIAILAIVIIAATVFFVNYDTEAQVKHQLSNVAQQYYEDYYYPTVFNSDQSLATNYFSKLPDLDTLGLSPIPLRQLILALPDLPESEVDFLRNHCDETATSVTFYPDEPYAKNSYHTEFNYSCDF